MNRIDRLTAILIQLQTKRIVRAEEISDRFEISLRTVYRDVKALMEAGIPIGSEAGKGYFIVDGFHLPPVMFTQEEANAMLMASKLVERMTDKSIQKTFESALMKIKSVLRDNEKDHLENLQAQIKVLRNHSTDSEFPDHFLNDIQTAIAKKETLQIDYFSVQGEVTQREVEPIGLFYYSLAWHMIAWCKMRNGYRDFRTDRIRALKNKGITFDDRNRYTLQEYLQSLKQSNHDMHEIRLLFDKPMSGYLTTAKHYYGYVSEEDLGDKIRMNFMTGHLKSFCRGILMHGSAVEVEHPEEARNIVSDLVEELAGRWLRVEA